MVPFPGLGKIRPLKKAALARVGRAPVKRPVRNGFGSSILIEAARQFSDHVALK
jgi:hypothetical protein